MTPATPRRSPDAQAGAIPATPAGRFPTNSKTSVGHVPSLRAVTGVHFGQAEATFTAGGNTRIRDDVVPEGSHGAGVQHEQDKVSCPWQESEHIAPTPHCSSWWVSGSVPCPC
jgi:hypothetical protein